MKEYVLRRESTRLDILEVLTHMEDDARDEARVLAMKFTQFGNMDDKAQAMYYMGKMDLIKSLLWALDGQAEKDGIENPTVSAE